MKVLLPEAYGFCYGVRSAVGKAEEALSLAERDSLPCYSYGDIVHSGAVMEGLLSHGMKRILSAREVMEPGYVVIRAHGITDQERAILVQNGNTIIDATCPVVLRSQSILRSSPCAVVIGQGGHSEVVALLGANRSAVLIENAGDLCRLESGECDAVVQTTFSTDELSLILSEAEEKGISLRLRSQVCRASIERREALIRLLERVEALVVAGDRSSRNTAELWRMGEKAGVPSFLVSSEEEIPDMVWAYGTVGLTAGASCPDTLIDSIKRRLENG